MGMLHYDIPDDLHRRAKAAAALEGKTLKDWLIVAIDTAANKNKRTR